MKLPRWLLYAVAILVVLSWVPLALIMRARVTTSPQPRIHVIPDMDNQPKFKAQARNPIFADRRAMRPPVEGAVPRGAILGDPALTSGKIAEDWVDAAPLEVDRELLRRGRERYDIYCSPCHGLVGFGDGMVAKRADELQEGTWTPPTSFHSELLRERPDGHIFNTITNGRNTMGGPKSGRTMPITRP